MPEPCSAPEKEKIVEASNHAVPGTGAPPADQQVQTANGSIAIKNGTFHVTDPGEEGAFAFLIPLPPLRLWLNDVELLAASPVRSSDRIEWERPADSLYEIDVSPDRMHAEVRVFSDIQYAWKLEDHSEAPFLSPKAVPDFEKPIRKLEIAEIMSEIGARGIRKNLDVPAIVQALQEAGGDPVRFACGSVPLPGSDARLELFFGDKIQHSFEEVDGALDYRSHLRIPSVQAGDPLARLVPSSPGTPGYDVYGEPVFPPPVREIDLRARQHVEAREDGTYVALKAGRPCITDGAVRYLDVSDAYVVAGDVDLKTGHIVFSGDVTIHGSVTDNMIVESLGNVHVSGGVYHSTITAAGSIVVQGSIIGSRLYSGNFGLAFNRLYHLSSQLKEEISLLIQASRTLFGEVAKRGQSTRFGQVVLLLLKTKFKEIQPRIRELLQVLVTVQRSTGSSPNAFADALNLMLSPAQLIDSLDEGLLTFLHTELEREHSFVADMQQGDARVEFSRCQTSTIKSNGDIVIHREGVMQSDLYSGGSIAFGHPSSVCRGSCLEAEKRIDAQIIGSAGGAPCILRAKQSIHVQHMFEGKVYVDGMHRDILSPVQNYTFGCAEDGSAAFSAERSEALSPSDA